MIKYFIYARKSSEGDDRQITSINDQVEECLKIAKRNNLEVVDIISESKSAKNPGRKRFNEMLQRIQNGEANGVITWKLNRIARNSLDGGSFIWQLQQGIIRHVQTISQGFYPKDNLVVMHIEFGMAGQYSIDLGESVKRGTLKKAERGWFPSPQLPTGYLHNTKKEIANGKHEIIIDTEQFNSVKSLWRRLLENKCQIQDLKAYGDAIGIKSAKGKLLCKSAYYRLFKNEFYCGFFYWNNEYGEKTKMQGKHTSMITIAEFDQAQRILSRNSVPTAKTTEIEKQFTGIFKCGECSGAFTPTTVNRAYCLNCKVQFSTKNKRDCPRCNVTIDNKEQFTFLYRVYYRCVKKSKNCKQPYILKEELEQQVIAYLKTLTINTDIYTWCIRYLEKQDNKNPNRSQEQELMKRISVLESKQKRYLEMRVEQELTKQEYQEYSTPIKDQIGLLKNELEQTEYEVINWKQELEKGLNFAQNLVEIFENGDVLTKRKLLLEISLNTTILDKKAHFVTPKRLREIQSMVQKKMPKNKFIEHEKSLINKGDSCGINLPFAQCGE